MDYNLFSIHSRVSFASLISASIHAASLYSYASLVPTAAPVKADRNNSLIISFSLPASLSSEDDLEKITPTPEIIEAPSPVVEQKTLVKKINNNEIAKTPVPKKDLNPQKKLHKKEINKKPQTSLIKEKKPAETTIKKQSERARIDPIASLQTHLIVVEEKDTIEKNEDRYLNALLEKIEQNKFYPKKARRRNIQGTVQVEMTLDQSGKLKFLQLSKGHKILRRAAQKAIQQAAPFDAPPASLATSSPIKFGIHYQFR